MPLVHTYKRSPCRVNPRTQNATRITGVAIGFRSRRGSAVSASPIQVGGAELEEGRLLSYERHQCRPRCPPEHRRSRGQTELRWSELRSAAQTERSVLPDGVRAAFLPMRSNSEIPSASSRALICDVTAGWDRLSSSAALLRSRHSATVRKTRSFRFSIMAGPQSGS